MGRLFRGIITYTHNVKEELILLYLKEYRGTWIGANDERNDDELRPYVINQILTDRRKKKRPKSDD